MASTSTQIVPYSSTPVPQHWPNDVFLSVRGEDTRYNFTDHLYTHLVGRGIRTFRDDPSLKRGEEIAPELLKAIEESRFSIVVFSKKYADSRWCLDELAKIMDCRKQMGQRVIPVFYHVDPSDVRNHWGRFGEAFSDYEEDTKEKKEKVRRWRTALTEAANLSGHHVEWNKGYESKVITQISKNILTTLNRDLLHVDESIVGINRHFEEVISQLRMYSNDVRFVGIFGCGGIGKTTITKVVYNKISHQYEGTSFLANVRETSISFRGLIELQKQLLDDIVVGGKHQISSVDQGKKMIQTNLWSKKVLIVLDDVDDMGQLESLVGSKKWFGQGSRIIVTTRDKHLLVTHGADESYHVKELNFEEAIELFSWNAFKQSHPKQEYRCLLECMVHYAKGLPLALQILGSFLYGKTIPEWESELGKLKIIPNMDVQGVLKISYDKLDNLQKQIFLDIACFFKGEDIDFVLTILDGCNLFATTGIRVLCDKCLISISDNNVIDMHDLIQQMGWDIVRGSHYEDPNRWSRLWNPKDISRAFAMEKGMKNIEGIILDLSRSNKIQINSKVWTKMKRLRFLKIYQSNRPRMRNNVGLPKDFKFASHELTYLHWEGFSLKSLPSNFYGQNLVQINLQGSNIRRLWEGNTCLQKLKVLILYGSEELIEISNFSSMPNLETLNLTFCKSLEKLDPSMGKLNKLVSLYLLGCTKLKSLPEIMEDMECLKRLSLSGTDIKELPSSVEHLIHLTDLNLSYCQNLRSLPSSICKLKFLKTLTLDGCSKLEAFPAIEEDMEYLEELDLSETGIKKLPSSVQHLRRLKWLQLNDCVNLVTLTNSIYNLTRLEALEVKGCSKLKKFPRSPGNRKSSSYWLKLDLSHGNWLEGAIPTGISQFCQLLWLNVSYCKVERVSEIPSNLRRIVAHGCTGLETLSSRSSLLGTCLVKWFKSAIDRQHAECVELPYTVLDMIIPGGGGSGIPGWVSHQQKGRQVKIELPLNWYQDHLFLGFAFFSLHHQHQDNLRCELTLHSNSNEVFVDLIVGRSDKCECPNHLWLVFYPKSNIPNEYHSNQFTHLEASFGFGNRGEWEDSDDDEDDDGDDDENDGDEDDDEDDCGGGDSRTINGGADLRTIKFCGVHLMYFQKHQQNNVQLEAVGTQDDDENMFDSEKFSDPGSTAGNTMVKSSGDSADQNQVEEPHNKRLRAV